MCWCPSGNAATPDEAASCGDGAATPASSLAARLASESAQSGASATRSSVARLGLLAAACADGDIRVFSVPSAEALRGLAAASRASNYGASSRSARPSGGGAVDGPILCRLAPVLQLQAVAPVLTLRLSWSPARPHKLLAAACDDGSIHVWDLQAARGETAATVSSWRSSMPSAMPSFHDAYPPLHPPFLPILYASLPATLESLPATPSTPPGARTLRPGM